MSQGQVTLKTRIGATMAGRFAALARRNERSVSAELRVAIAGHLANHDAPKEGRP